MIAREKTAGMKKIPPFKLVPKPQSEDATNLPKFKWTSKEIGTRHQLGGEPNFLQNESWPECPSCREEMTFYGQFDSVNDDICIADCGMIYVFLCFDCYKTVSMVHSY
jgi:Domain of unknown function (DUF1963)